MKQANRLRVLRAEHSRPGRKLTQRVIALRAGISISKYCHIENGYIVANAGDQKRIARALRVEVDQAFPSAQAVAS